MIQNKQELFTAYGFTDEEIERFNDGDTNDELSCYVGNFEVQGEIILTDREVLTAVQHAISINQSSTE